MSLKSIPPKTPPCNEEPGLRELELTLRTTKEIVVKFIEMGKVTPSTFPEIFELVHRTVDRAVSAARTRPVPENAGQGSPPDPSRR